MRSAQDMLAFEGRVRFFSPREILNLLGFPASFAFPSALPRRQQSAAEEWIEFFIRNYKIASPDSEIA